MAGDAVRMEPTPPDAAGAPPRSTLLGTVEKLTWCVCCEEVDDAASDILLSRGGLLPALLSRRGRMSRISGADGCRARLGARATLIKAAVGASPAPSAGDASLDRGGGLALLLCAAGCIRAISCAFVCSACCTAWANAAWSGASVPSRLCTSKRRAASSSALDPSSSDTGDGVGSTLPSLAAGAPELSGAMGATAANDDDGLAASSDMLPNSGSPASTRLPTPFCASLPAFFAFFPPPAADDMPG